MHQFLTIFCCFMTLSSAFLISFKINYTYEYWKYIPHKTISPWFNGWVITKKLVINICQANFIHFFRMQQFLPVNFTFQWWYCLQLCIVVTQRMFLLFVVSLYFAFARCCEQIGTAKSIYSRNVKHTYVCSVLYSFSSINTITCNFTVDFKQLSK